MPLQTKFSVARSSSIVAANSGFWWCSASVEGKQRRASTKEENLALAKTLAEDWYLELCGKV